MEDKKILEIHFLQLISSLYSSCMFQIMNPITGKVERDLAGARATIELLRMIEAKTKGNLSDKERNALTDALANMQMNYVDEVKREQEKKPENKKNANGKDSKGRIIVP
jgi:hypothetical protein